MSDLEKSEGERQQLKDKSSGEIVLVCAKEASRFKALDMVLLDVSAFSSFADYFVICSGKSSRQVQSIADNVEESLREMGLKPLGVEGKREGHWVLMDYGDIIIHIFYEPVRAFYDLESLWADASRLPWKDDAEEDVAQQQ
ncbi:MAG: ribosome silencing factor [Desulfobacteraceae bacterium]|nr:ribosome silencing factor [Desulfobacteraceae bacterium]